MTTRKRATPKKATKKKPKAAPRRRPRKPTRPTNEDLEARRRRLVELWGLPDRIVAAKLIEEGFFVEPADGRLAINSTVFAESCRRTVTRDRTAIREGWRTPHASTVRDRNESVEEYIARLQTCVDLILERLMTKGVKDTPYASLMDSLLRYQAAIAKARGTDAAPPIDPDPDGELSSRPFLGVLVGLDNCSPDARKKINSWLETKRTNG